MILGSGFEKKISSGEKFYATYTIHYNDNLYNYV